MSELMAVIALEKQLTQRQKLETGAEGSGSQEGGESGLTTKLDDVNLDDARDAAGASADASERAAGDGGGLELPAGAIDLLSVGSVLEGDINIPGMGKEEGNESDERKKYTLEVGDMYFMSDTA
jgi:hypothetical protein